MNATTTYTQASAELPYRFAARLTERHRRFLVTHADLAGITTSEALRDLLDQLIADALEQAHDDPENAWPTILAAGVDVESDDLALGEQRR